MHDQALLRVHALRVAFRTDKHQYSEAIKGISFEVPRNTMVALVGESGSGKSVSSLAVMGLLPRETARIGAESEIWFEGRNVLACSASERRALCGREISMIFQEPMTSLNPVLTVGYQIGEVLRLHKGLRGAALRARTLALLEEVGIPDPEHKIEAYPSQMSGGQQQRVMIAMAIACEPKLLIADEPTTALDVTIQKQIVDLIQSLRKKHAMSVLFITHDLALVGEIADQVIVMRQGEIRETGSAEQIFCQPQDAYTRALLHCRPTLDQAPARLPVIADFMEREGALPAPAAPPRPAVPPKPEIVLEVRDLCTHFRLSDGLFGTRVFKAVDQVSFSLARGTTLGVVGESGSGKTTMGLTLMRLHQATAGQVLFQGRDLLTLSERAFHAYKRRLQIVFQNPYASLNPRFTVGHILQEPMRIHGIGTNDAERSRMAMQLLDRVGLPATAYARYPHEFSGGQRQRIAIARCLTLKPEVLVCDESVSALDVSVQAQVLNLLQDLQDEYQLSYIFISHDLSVVKYLSDQVMVMNQGRVVECADADTLYRAPQEDYTRRLLAAIPQGWKGERGAAEAEKSMAF